MTNSATRPVLEFHFDYLSPYTYLADTQLGSLDAEIDYRPVAIVPVMALVNNQPSPKCPPKGRYAGIDAARWATRYGVKLQSNPGLWGALSKGFDAGVLIRGALAAQAQGTFTRYHHAIFNAVWRDNGDVVTQQGRDAILAAAGLDPAALWREADAPATVALLEARIKAAAEKGVFGTPTFFLGDEPFFGNDRLDFIRERLAA
jgi:2-hydroxychromene-2-carboxylate isomerase